MRLHCAACRDVFDSQDGDHEWQGWQYCEECYNELAKGVLDASTFDQVPNYMCGLTPRQRAKLNVTSS